VPVSNLTADPILLNKDVIVFACVEKLDYYLYLALLNSNNKIIIRI
jgi:hypothetical protein